MSGRGWKIHRAYYLFSGVALAAVGLVLVAALLAWPAAAQDSSPPSFPSPISVHVLYPGVTVNQLLPAATGGSGAIAYSISPDISTTPANGLSFNAATRTLSGTPTAAAPTVRYTITATDANGATGAMIVSVTVIADVCGGVDTWHPAGVTPNAGLVKDCNILLSGKDQLRDTDATKLTAWDIGTHISDWEGITLYGDDRGVQTIGLDGNDLAGLIPEQWGGLSALEALDLSSNQLKGEIPPELGSLDSLERLYLYDNQLTGEIPAELGSLDSLERLYLYDNQLTGEIPAELGSLDSLEYLRLGNNQLTGEIPAELGSLDSLEYLRLGNNQLTGEIPAELGSLDSLEYLRLGNNQLTGEIPAELGSLDSLEYLRLGNNQLTGEIPAELGSLDSLERLYLYDNQLTGEIPAELGSLASLEYLRLGNNQLTGEIPEELGSLASLRFLYLHSNQLTGEIPAELGSLASLVFMDLRDNQLRGEIPEELGNLASLLFLFLHRNGLTGEIPAELGSLASLAFLDLNNNQLGGEIPEELGSLASLVYLDLSDNQLEGEISEELGNLDSLEHLKLGNNQLGGEIPEELGSLASLFGLYLHDNQLTGEIPVELGNLDSLVYLDLSNNQLTGQIPAEFAGPAKLPALTSLVLYGNMLTTPVEFSVTPAGPLSENAGATVFTAEVSITDPGAIWAAGVDDPYGITEDSNLVTGGVITAAGSGTSRVVSVNIDPASRAFSMALDGTITGALTFTLTPDDDTIDQADETVTFSLSGTGAPGGTDTTLEAEPVTVTVTDNDGVEDVCSGVDTWHPAGVATPAAGLVKDCNILLSARDQLRGTDATKLTTWDIGTRMSDWEGITLYGDDRGVQTIGLNGNDLAGSIPGQLGGLSALEVLILSKNQLTGEIPVELGNLASLVRLYLYSNQLTGGIPAEFADDSQFPSLILWYVYDNMLTTPVDFTVTPAGPLSEAAGAAVFTA